MEDMKYMPMISDRKRTTLVVDPLPTLETAKKNCTENETRQLKFRVRFIQKKSRPQINGRHHKLIYINRRSIHE